MELLYDPLWIVNIPSKAYFGEGAQLEVLRSVSYSCV